MKSQLMDKTTPSEVPVGVQEPMFYLRKPYSLFTKEGNQILKNRRIDYITPFILRVWIARYITKDDHKDPKWFNLSLENDEIVAYFTFEDEMKQAEKLLKEVTDNGFVSAKNWW